MQGPSVPANCTQLPPRWRAGVFRFAAQYPASICVTLRLWMLSYDVQRRMTRRRPRPDHPRSSHPRLRSTRGDARYAALLLLPQPARTGNKTHSFPKTLVYRPEISPARVRQRRKHTDSGEGSGEAQGRQFAERSPDRLSTMLRLLHLTAEHDEEHPVSATDKQSAAHDERAMLKSPHYKCTRAVWP